MASEFETNLMSKVLRLPPDRQREVLNFVEALERKTSAQSTPGARKKLNLEEIDALFKETQSLPQVLALTDDDIAAEIAAYRAGR